MPPTSYPNGVLSMGGLAALGPFSPMNGRKHIWVRGVTSVATSGSNRDLLGNDGAPGDNPDEPLRTMARAFVLAEPGCTIHFTGNIREQLNSPAGLFDVTIVGEGNRPRHADAHTGNNGYSAATWKSPAVPVAVTPLLKVRQQGWRFANILFANPSDAPALDFMRDAAAGDDERDSSHAEVLGCRFAGGSSGIKITGTEIVHNLFIHDNIFNDITRAIWATAYYARRAVIEHNIFELNTNHIVAAFGDSHILNNSFGQFTTLSIDLTGGNGHNVITGNYLSGTYSIAGGYKKSNANDEWAGNQNVAGVTTVVPA